MKIKTDIDSKDKRQLDLKLQAFEAKIKAAEAATRNAAKLMETKLRENLESQGREGGHPPPLSEMTKDIYARSGEPDGSGIRDHIEIITYRRGGRQFSTVGIHSGRPSIIAQVQNNGATIAVTDKMRGYLSAKFGIHLKASTTHIVIPGRSFWDDAFKEASAELKRELTRIFAE